MEASICDWTRPEIRVRPVLLVFLLAHEDYFTKRVPDSAFEAFPPEICLRLEAPRNGMIQAQNLSLMKWKYWYRKQCDYYYFARIKRFSKNTRKINHATIYYIGVEIKVIWIASGQEARNSTCETRRSSIQCCPHSRTCRDPSNRCFIENSWSIGERKPNSLPGRTKSTSSLNWHS